MSHRGTPRRQRTEVALWAQTQLERQLETAQIHNSDRGCVSRKLGRRRRREGGSTTGEPGASSGRGNSVRELGSWRSPGYRASRQQQCRLAKDAVPVRADRPACQAGTYGRERPWEASARRVSSGVLSQRPGAHVRQERAPPRERHGNPRQKQTANRQAPHGPVAAGVSVDRHARSRRMNWIF